MKPIRNFSKYGTERLIIITFLMAWVILNLVQARFTELLDDEAYYWMYSRNLDWGFFDHPPMTALLIKIGYGLVANELGVRLLFVFMTGATIYLMWTLVPRNDNTARPFVFAVSAVAIMHFNVAGFVATPDPPLAFFATSFLVIYKRYLEQDKLKFALALALIITAMIYTKYHAALFIGIIILANPGLFRRKSFYFIAFMVIVCFLPHILWQVDNDFPTLRYHLIGRSNYFKPKQIYEFIGNQILVTGPLIGILLLYIAFRHRPLQTFDKTLKYIVVGFFAFFFLSTFKGHVEPHWTAPAIPSLLVLSIPALSQVRFYKKWIVIGFWITVPLILLMRLYLMIEYVELPVQLSQRFHKNDIWAAQVRTKSAGRPVVFRNSYQLASWYNFYSGEMGTSRNDILYRKNQYDLWDFETLFQGREVFYHQGKSPHANTLTTVRQEKAYRIIAPYCSNTRIKIEPDVHSLTVKKGTFFRLGCTLTNPRQDTAYFACREPNRTRIYTSQYESKRRPRRYSEAVNGPELPDMPGNSSLTTELKILAPLVAGQYEMIIGLGSNALAPGLNSRPIRLQVIE